MKTLAALLFIVCSAQIAHADNPSDPICQQSTDFGLSPGQIADKPAQRQPVDARVAATWSGHQRPRAVSQPVATHHRAPGQIVGRVPCCVARRLSHGG